MATENQDNDKMETAPSLTKRGASRRRLAKAGIGAGIIATLESKSAMAADMVCRSPSGSLSHGLAASHYKNGTAPACEGRSPGYWKNTSSWPVARDMMFTAVFYAAKPATACPTRAAEYKNGDYYNPGSYYYARLEDMLNPQSFDKNNVGMHLVAAFLNFRSGKIGFVDLNDLQTMWSELQSTGRYSPTAGVYWDNKQVADYLASIHEL